MNDQPYDSPGFVGPEFKALLSKLSDLTIELDHEDAWPADQFQQLGEAGVLGWVIPQIYGGSEISQADLIRGYELLAGSCLLTTFVLTQRNGACLRIAGSENDELKSELLPELCSGKQFATVGISHLTTSRQHLQQPAVRAEQTAQGWAFEGTIPWVTGAIHADYIVTGGTCDDGRQVLAVIPTAAHGVTSDAPVRLMALNASQTGSVQLDAVEVEDRFLVAGPIEHVMKQGQGGGPGSLTTSALATGLAAAATGRLADEASRRPDLREIHANLSAEGERLSNDIRELATDQASAAERGLNAESIRQRANSLVLRATQAHLAAAKGAGYVRGHLAERSVREAMFFLVWSCPQPVLSAALRELACVLE